MKKISLYILMALLVYSCGGSDQGELVGERSQTKWHSQKPLGMVLIPGGSFTMGKEDEDVAGSLTTPARTVTVRPYYMDETEITNAEYKEFVFWVRDSIVRTKLAILSELMSDDTNTILPDYQFKNIDTADMTPYEKYMMNNYGSLGDVNSPLQGRSLSWEEDLLWDTSEFPDEYYSEVMDTMYVSIENSFDGKRILDTKKLKFKYSWLDRENAAKVKGERKDFIKSEIVEVYPDTTVWVKDFSYSYNDPMHQDYFHHQAYDDYPVVGVSWSQAKAFCRWRTKKKNDFLRSKKNPSSVPYFRLATEAEWEYAARGGLDYATYPWGGPYTTSDRGCFLANFKPVRGDYAVDGALYTMEAKSYNPNDYGLYNMAGNVSEWTNTAYNEASYYIGSTMNPNVENTKNHRKIIRGGSWKDVAYFLEVSTRDYEYADSSRSYIGFRTVQDFLGTNIEGN
ncbi:MAG: gliding motility lipoprotein GldK [Lutibacter sp.]|uniref:type IX secretion system lipoprotein PorK/GldK n=1 Tax=Lutibacter sp. TaxID=1925666 RepID=UPI00181381CF|nr:gliding motility lipoprotein GldK [Lutibacter sp.]MBT8316823.1 gliding motility lipoprotein GldK [Lutibacter sp.]NNJ57683.1 gliding motility lipoprotein GldK [Lutibacter sp.]